MENNLNLFEEEFYRVAEEKNYILLSHVLKMDFIEEKTTLYFMDDNKDGRFTLQNFNKLSQIYLNKKERYKEHEFSSRLQAYFTILMWKQVCSKEGEEKYIDWIKTLLIEDQINRHTDTSDDDILIDEDFNLDPNKYLDKPCTRLLYDILNVKQTHSIDFQSFFDLLQSTCIELDLIEVGNESMDNYIHVDVLDIFCKNFIRGFSKLIIDLGFDTSLLEGID